MSVVGLQRNPTIAAHYARKRAQGKSKMNALGHCMKKSLAIVWASGAAVTTSRRSRLSRQCDTGLDLDRDALPHDALAFGAGIQNDRDRGGHQANRREDEDRVVAEQHVEHVHSHKQRTCHRASGAPVVTVR